MAVEYQLNLPFDSQFESGYRTGTLNRRRSAENSLKKLVPVKVFAAW